jgi:hypothetical protein
MSTLNLTASGIDRLGKLRVPGDCALEQEEPVFAATSEFAAEFGGPITRAFLQALPDSWSKAPLVVDTSLVWLPAGVWRDRCCCIASDIPSQSAGRSSQPIWI